MTRVKTDVDTYGSRLSLDTLFYAVDKIKKGAVADRVLEASYSYLEVAFLAQMIKDANSGTRKLTHVFDYGSDGGLGNPLWKLVQKEQGKEIFIGYTFIDSNKPVPHDPELQGIQTSTHIFRKKAELMESAEGVIIERKDAVWLVYINRHKGAGTVEKNQPGFSKGSATFHKGPSYIYESGGGKFRNNFDNAFFTWWSFGASKEEALDFLSNKLTRQVAVQAARWASVKRVVGRHKGTITNPNTSAEAKRNAEKMIQDIRKQWKGAKRAQL